MIIITGTVEIRENNLKDALALCLKHVAYSRTEAGCISHAVTQEIENPLRLFFFEEWQDNDAIETHFVQPTSQQFVKNLSALCASPPSMTIYGAEKIRN